jgi:hypothetical protein
MNRRPNARVKAAKRVKRESAGGAYIFFCGSIVVTVAALTITSFLLPPRKLQSTDLQKLRIPVAKIELNPDRKGECRHILFHNDSGRFEEGGTGRCSGLNTSDEDGQVAAERRSEALKKAFKF